MLNYINKAKNSIFRHYNQELIDSLSQISYLPTPVLSESCASGRTCLLDGMLQEYTNHQQLCDEFANPEVLDSLNSGQQRNVFVKYLFTSTEEENKLLVLNDIEYLSQCRDGLYKFVNFATFAEMSYRQHRTDFPNLTESAYREWLLREVVKPDNNTFIHVPWMSGIKYLNSDGAHRFGAAWFSNLMESANTRIIGKFVKYDFNTAWLSQLSEYCHAYVTTFETEHDLALFVKAFSVYSESRMASFGGDS